MTPDGFETADPSAAAMQRWKRHVDAPATAIKTVCLMIVGLGLAVTLIVKVYMLVLTDLHCAADGTSLGNLIRCTATLEILAATLALVAGFELAFLTFLNRLDLMARPIVLGLGSALLLLVSGATADTVTWQTALFLTALTVSAIAFAILRVLAARLARRPDSRPDGGSAPPAPR